MHGVRRGIHANVLVKFLCKFALQQHCANTAFLRKKFESSSRHIINRAAMGRARFLFYTGFIINRAAMGRARFLFYTGFIINRAAMGRARFLLYTGFIIFLTARPWAERGSCFARDLLTARPWAERGSCFTRDLLLLFFFMSVTRRKPPLGQIVIGTESRNL